MSEELEHKLKLLGACGEAVAWAKGKTFKKAWAECERGDWMLWLVDKMQGKDGWPTRQQIVHSACDCYAASASYAASVAYAASYDASAAYAASYAASAAIYASSTHMATQKQCADICRKRFTVPEAL
jgi:hypothetical protein